MIKSVISFCLIALTVCLLWSTRWRYADLSDATTPSRTQRYTGEVQFLTQQGWQRPPPVQPVPVETEFTASDLALIQTHGVLQRPGVYGRDLEFKATVHNGTKMHLYSITFILTFRNSDRQVVNQQTRKAVCYIDPLNTADVEVFSLGLPRDESEFEVTPKGGGWNYKVVGATGILRN